MVSKMITCEEHSRLLNLQPCVKSVVLSQPGKRSFKT